jgi:hypothetical protein
MPIIASSILHIAQNSQSVDLKNYALTHFSVSLSRTHKAAKTMIRSQKTKLRQGSDISPSERSSFIPSFAVSEQSLMIALYKNVRMGYATQITVSARRTTKTIHCNSKWLSSRGRGRDMKHPVILLMTKKSIRTKSTVILALCRHKRQKPICSRRSRHRRQMTYSKLPSLLHCKKCE